MNLNESSSLAPFKGLHISNALTYLSIFSCVIGFLFYLKTFHFSYVGLGLCFSFIFDLFDGQFAKKFKNRPELVSQMGGTLDSLADFAVFGLIPALTLMTVSSSISVFVIGFFFIFSSMTRLAAFHVLSASQNYFVGLPTTLTGLIFSMALAFTRQPAVLAFVLLILAFLMIANFKITRPSKKGLFILCVLSLVTAGIHVYMIRT